jgi:GAF domain-containing protein
VTVDAGVRAVDRLVDLARLGLDREAERLFLADLVDAAAARLGTPFVVIDVLLDRAQLIIAAHGPVPDFIAEAGGTPLEWSFCLPLVSGRRAHVVPDLAADPMFRDNPLVTVAGVRSYLGAPLISERGQVLGGLCGLDLVPRSYGPGDLAFLRGMADEVVHRLEERAGPE